jgi:hypothetical protein
LGCYRLIRLFQQNIGQLKGRGINRLEAVRVPSGRLARHVDFGGSARLSFRQGARTCRDHDP